ncbi:MAG: PIG-L family deacetylase [Anaerolineae bacterium]|nr:PIG-L family deacetylase [Anaerolineae bacterium]
MTTPPLPYKAAEPLTAPCTILVIVAHHDDIEFGVAGSVARWVQEGARVVYVIVTDGGAGSNEPDIRRADLVERRRQEQIAAAAVVGVPEVHFLGYPDAMLQPTLELRRHLTQIIRQVRPDRVVCQDPTTVYFGDGYINHPDHRAAGEASLYAVFPSAETRPAFPELLDAGYAPHHVRELWLTLSVHNTHYVDITATIDLKLAALRCHVSQIGAGAAAENGALAWIKQANDDGGQQVGVRYAEFYKVMRFDRDGDSAPQSATAAEATAGE